MSKTYLRSCAMSDLLARNRFWSRIAALATLALVGVSETQAQIGPYADHGVYGSVLFTGMEEWDGPKPTAGTDLGLFSGLGLAGAAGYRWLPLRLELEYQSNVSYKLFGGREERLRIRSLLLNGIVEGQLFRWFGVFVGAGLGRAKVEVDLETCLDLGGCPPFSASHTSGSASARQVQLGVTIGPFWGQQAVIGFRRLKSGALGLTDIQGRPFGVDRADVSMSFAGWRGNF